MKPTRFAPAKEKMTLSESIRHAWFTLRRNHRWEWIRSRTVLKRVEPGDPRYESAPYEVPRTSKKKP